MKSISSVLAAAALALAPATAFAQSGGEARPAGMPAMTCPWIEGIWAPDGTSRVIAVDQDGCQFEAMAAGDRMNTNTRGYWTGQGWVFASTSMGRDGCMTTSWGRARADGSGRVTLTTLGDDGLCGRMPDRTTVVLVPRT